MIRIFRMAATMLAAMHCAFGQAEERLVAGAGPFTLVSGSPTVVIQAGYYFSMEAGQFYEMGGELQYRTFRTTVFGLPDVEITSFSIPCVLSWKVAQPPVVPYAGIGVIFGLSMFDRSSLESRQPGLSISSSTASSYGFMFLGGMRVHLESGISFFCEYRFGWDEFSTELNGVKSPVKQGGSWLLGGIGIGF